MSPLLPSDKEAVVLRLLLEHGEMSGVALVRASSELRRGTIYVMLGRMEEKEYVVPRQLTRPGIRPRRRLYRIAEAGERALRAMDAAAAVWEQG